MVFLSSSSGAETEGSHSQAPGLPPPPNRPPIVGARKIRGAAFTSPDAGANPVWGATATLREADSGLRRVSLTGTSGEFSFEDLPDGRYVLSLSKPGHVLTTYGASTTTTQGIPIAVSGQDVSDLRMIVPVGGVISGRVVDPTGRPFVGGTVSALTRRRTGISHRFLVTGSAITDDHGIYRVYGLGVGEYYIAASYSSGPDGRARSSGSQPGLQPRSEASRRSYSPVFYPGTDEESKAIPVLVRSVAEVERVDFVFDTAFTSVLRGTVTDREKRSVGNLQVMALRSNDTMAVALGETASRALLSQDGSFSFDGLQPGTVNILVRSADRSPSPLTPLPQVDRTSETGLWGRARAIIGPGPQPPLQITLEPGARVTGRIEADRGILPAALVTRFGVRLMSMDDQGGDFGAQVVPIEPTGSFSVGAVPPGTYRILVGPGNGLTAPEGWLLNSAVMNNIDVSDQDFVVGAGETLGPVVIKMTQSQTEISGRVVQSSGTAAIGRFVVAYPAESRFQVDRSRRLRGPVRTATDGSYRFLGMPPGDYYVAVIDEFAADSWSSRPVFRSGGPSLVKVSLRGGERTAQDLEIDK